MRRILCFLLIICCFVSIVGCTPKQEQPENSVAVYYRKDKPTYGTIDGVIAPTYMQAPTREAEYASLLNQYLETAPDEGFAQTFPKGTSLLRFRLEGLTVKVVLSDAIAEYSGMDLAIALTCLTHTVISVTGCQEVIISASTKQLDGQNFVTLNRDSYLLIDQSGAI